MEPQFNSGRSITFTDDELRLLRESVERELMRCRIEGVTRMKDRHDRLTVILDLIDQQLWRRAERSCARCGHPPDWHRHDDVNDDHPPTDPTCPFRCLGYDCESPGPVPPGGRACDCPDYESIGG